MLEIKSELETKISTFFKENMIMSILEFLKFSKENLWQISHLKETLKDEKLIEKEIENADKNSEFSDMDQEEQDYDSEDSFIADDENDLFQEDDDHEARRIKTQFLEDDNHQELKQFMRKPLVGHNEANSNALIDFSDIMTDVFNAIPFMKEEVYIMSKMASGITGKRKFEYFGIEIDWFRAWYFGSGSRSIDQNKLDRYCLFGMCQDFNDWFVQGVRQQHK